MSKMKSSSTRIRKPTRPPRAAKKADDEEFLAHFRHPALFSYATDAEHLLRKIHDYLKRRTESAQLELVLHGSTLTRLEIEGVLNAEVCLEAAEKLLGAKLDRLS